MAGISSWIDIRIFPIPPGTGRCFYRPGCRYSQKQAASLKELNDARIPNALIHALTKVFDVELIAVKREFATKIDLAGFNSALKADLARVRSELKIDMAELKAELRTEIHATSASVTRQMYLAILGQMAVLLGAACFFVTQLR